MGDALFGPSVDAMGMGKPVGDPMSVISGIENESIVLLGEISWICQDLESLQVVEIQHFFKNL